jgi:hypothetical protein
MSQVVQKNIAMTTTVCIPVASWIFLFQNVPLPALALQQLASMHVGTHERANRKT